MANFTIEPYQVPGQKVTVAADKTAIALEVTRLGDLGQVIFLTGITALSNSHQVFDNLGDAALATVGAGLDVLDQLDLQWIYDQLLQYGSMGLLDPAAEISYLLASLADGDFKNKVLAFLASKQP